LLQEIDFEAGTFPTGIYFYRLVATFFDGESGQTGETIQQTKKMILLK